MPVLSEAELIDAISRYTRLMERRARTAFLNAVRDASGSPEMRQVIAELKQSGTVDPGLVNRIGGVAIDTSALQVLARDAMIGGGQVTNRAMGARLGARFDMLNPEVIEWSRLNSMRMVGHINGKLEETLRTTVTRALEQGTSPLVLAEELRDVIGLDPRLSNAVINYRQSLIDAGYPLGTARKLAREYAEDLLRYRARVIARTEMLNATNAGQHAFWLQAKQTGFLDDADRRQWIITPDERLCKTCLPMSGKKACCRACGGR